MQKIVEDWISSIFSIARYKLGNINNVVQTLSEMVCKNICW